MAGCKAYTDFRGEISFETDVWLETRARRTGRTRQDIVRELLHEKACEYLAEVKLAAALLEANPAVPEDAGRSRSGSAAKRRGSR